MMQKIVSESNGSHALLTESAKQKHKEDLTESINVVPAKYPPNIKLDRKFLQLYSARAEKFCVP